MLTDPAVTWPSVGFARASCGRANATAAPIPPNAVPASQVFRPLVNDRLRPLDATVPRFSIIMTPPRAFEHGDSSQAQKVYTFISSIWKFNSWNWRENGGCEHSSVQKEKKPSAGAKALQKTKEKRGAGPLRGPFLFCPRQRCPV